MRLIYFSPVHWQSYEQRSHKFVRYFRAHVGGDVLWVQPYPVRLPVRGDFRRKRSAVDQGTPAATGVKCLAVAALPVEPIPYIRSLNKPLQAAAWETIQAFADCADPLIIGIGKPSGLAWQALTRLRHDNDFYDAMDNFPDFYAGLSKNYMAHIETRIAAGVERVFASSEAIRQRLKFQNQNVELVRNACDVGRIPERGRAQPGKTVFGYIGSIGRWFDWRLLADLAAAVPEAEFRLVGPVFEPPNAPLPDNIVFAGAQSQGEAIQMMMEFTVGLIPFKINALTDGVDPIKYYEYICAGLPVISSPFGEMKKRHIADGVFQVSAGDRLSGIVQEAARHELSPQFVREFRQHNDWSDRWRECQLW